jgi:hypothetical protein
MKDSLGRVLCSWGDSKFYWIPFSALRPERARRMGLGPVLAHGLSGLLWTGLLFAVLGRLTWPGRWSLEAFLVPGLAGGVAGWVWAAMVALAWNRRAAELATRRAPADSAEPAAATASEPLGPAERWLVQPAALLAVLALAVALVVGVENLRGDLAFRRLVGELRTRGAPVTLAEIVSPPIPDERNLAMSPLLKPGLDYDLVPSGEGQHGGSVRWRDTNGWNRLQHLLAVEDPKSSFAAFVTKRPAGSARRSDRLGWTDGVAVNLEDWRDYYRSLPDWPKPAAPATAGAEVLIALGRHDADLQEWRAAAAERPECRFPLRFEDGPGMLLPNLSVLKRVAGFLRLRASALLAENRTDEALAEIRLAARMGDAIADEPILISLLVRFSIDQLLLQPVWEGCRERRWSDGQLAALQALLARRDHLGATRRAIDGERILAGVTYDMLARHDGRIWELTDGTDGDGPIAALIRMMPRGWVRQSQIAHYRYLQALVEDLAAAKSHVDLGPEDRRLDQYIKRNSLFTLIASMLAPAIDKVSHRTFETETWRRLALVGLALERYHLAEGRYPETLAALTPRFLAAVPEDPMNGQPLRYALQADGNFRLYSVGRDHADDGGRRSDRRARSASDRLEPSDLVWR